MLVNVQTFDLASGGSVSFPVNYVDDITMQYVVTDYVSPIDLRVEASLNGIVYSNVLDSDIQITSNICDMLVINDIPLQNIKVTYVGGQGTLKLFVGLG